MATLRYNMQGELNPLFAAAAAVGQNQSMDQQKALDQQFLNQELNRRAQSRAGADAFTQDAMRLQLAGQQLAQRSAPTVQAPRSVMPLSPAVTAAKGLARTSKLAGVTLTPEQTAAVDQLEKASDVSPDRFSQTLDDIVKSNTAQQKQDEAVESKRQKFAFAQSLATEFPDEQIREQIKALVNDPDTTLAQLRTAISQLRSARATEKRATDTQKAKELSDQRGADESDRRKARDAAEVIRRKLINPKELDPGIQQALFKEYKRLVGMAEGGGSSAASADPLGIR